MQRNGLSAEAAAARIKAQLPIEEKRRRAGVVIDNSGRLEATRAQVARLWRQWHV
jgi:dephospho-CoA kinase